MTSYPPESSTTKPVGGLPVRRTRRCATVLAAAVLGIASAAVAPSASAQSMKPGGNGTTIQNPANVKPNGLDDVGIDQKLGAQVPGDLTFTDSFGQPVRLADLYAKGKPILLNLVYFQCPRTCTASLNEMTKAMRTMSLNPGTDFEVVVVSFDPREGPALAAEKKLAYQSLYKRPGTEAGWNFLTGDEANIKALAASVGFRYTWDAKHDQYVHAAGLMALTPRGKVSKYMYGVEYTGLQLKLALIDAAEGKLGTLANEVLRFCFEYDPHAGKYTFAIMTFVRAACVLTVVGLVGFMLVNFRRDRAAAAVPAGSPDAGANPPTGGPAADAPTRDGGGSAGDRNVNDNG
jgi:protein SCO1/2